MEGLTNNYRVTRSGTKENSTVSFVTPDGTTKVCCTHPSFAIRLAKQVPANQYLHRLIGSGIQISVPI